MITVQDTTIVRNWSSQLDRQTVEAALKDAGILYEDVYPTPRPGVWQLEAYGSAKRIAASMSQSGRLASVKTCQDEMDGQAYALVMFSVVENERRV